MPSPATLRLATAADVPAIARLGAATFVETFGSMYAPEDLSAFLSGSRSETVYAALLQEQDVSIWLAELEGAGPVGYAVAGNCKLPVANLEAEAGEVRELYVLADYQQHRLGTQLLTAALQWLAARNRAPLYVGVWSENYGAQRLYGRFGFEKAGEYDFPVGCHVDREFILKQRCSHRAIA